MKFKFKIILKFYFAKESVKLKRVEFKITKKSNKN